MIVHSLKRYPLLREGVLVLLLTTLFGCFLFLQPGNFEMTAIGDPLLQVSVLAIGCLLALPLCLPGAQRTGGYLASFLKAMTFTKTPQQWVPLLLLLSILGHITGQAILLYYGSMDLAVPSPSWADIACLITRPPLLLAILLLPAQPLPTKKRLHIVLDGFMIMVGAITLSWYFILGPSIVQRAATMATQIVSLAYPLEVLFLVFCLLLLMLRTNDQTIRPVVLLLSLGLTALTISYSIFGYQRLHHLFHPGELLEVGWVLGYLLIGLAARAMLVSKRLTSLPISTSSASLLRQQEPVPAFVSLPLWQSLLPYVLILPIVLLLVGISYLESNSGLESGVYLGVILLMGLLVLRQIFTVRATVAQNNALNCMQLNLRETNQTLKLTNAQLKQQTGQLERANEQLKRQAEQLEQANAQLSHLNQLRDQFIANVNHELRTPLTQIDGYLELLSEYQGRIDETTQAIFVQHAKEGSQELLLLVNNILDALRVEREVAPPHLEQIVLWQVVHEVCEQFPPEAEQGPRLQVDLPTSLVVKADPCYLRQILRNLFSNALKYSPKDAAVTVRAQQVDAAGSSHVRISVQDEGLGIPPEEQPLLFQKFVRLKRDLAGPIQGTGLGLYMCKQLVEAMKGEIWVESSGNKGEGSNFCFTLVIQR